MIWLPQSPILLQKLLQPLVFLKQSLSLFTNKTGTHKTISPGLRHSIISPGNSGYNFSNLAPPKPHFATKMAPAFRWPAGALHNNNFMIYPRTMYIANVFDLLSVIAEFMAGLPVPLHTHVQSHACIFICVLYFAR